MSTEQSDLLDKIHPYIPPKVALTIPRQINEITDAINRNIHVFLGKDVLVSAEEVSTRGEIADLLSTLFEAVADLEANVRYIRKCLDIRLWGLFDLMRDDICSDAEVATLAQSCRKRLEDAGIKTVSDLIGKTKTEIFEGTLGIGPVRMKYIVSALAKYGLKLKEEG